MLCCYAVMLLISPRLLPSSIALLPEVSSSVGSIHQYLIAAAEDNPNAITASIIVHTLHLQKQNLPVPTCSYGLFAFAHA